MVRYFLQTCFDFCAILRYKYINFSIVAATVLLCLFDEWIKLFVEGSFSKALSVLNIAVRICKSAVSIELWLLYSSMIFIVYRIATFGFTSLYLCCVFRFSFSHESYQYPKYVTSIVELSYPTKPDWTWFMAIKTFSSHNTINQFLQLKLKE